MKQTGLLMGAILALCGNVAAADLDEIKDRGVLRVAIANLSPFIVTHADGTLDGYEIESTRALGEHLGVAVEYIEKPFCELAEAIINDEADIIASGYSNTQTRRRILDFSLPYHDTEYYVVVEKKAAKTAKSLMGLNNEAIAIGYQEGGVSGMVARGEFSGSDLQNYSSFTEMMDALREGDLDGAVLFAPYTEWARKLKGRDYIVPHDFPLTRTIEAYALQQDADDLREALNAWVIEKDIEGYWRALEDKWFNPETAEISAPPPHACPGVVAMQ